MPDTSRLIWGVLYDGVDGPTLLLILSSGDAALWLRDRFCELAAGRTMLRLDQEAQVTLRDVDRLELRLEEPRPSPRLRRDRKRPREFVWSGRAYDWETSALLLAGLIDGKRGHQYLDEPGDHLVVEVSLGEHEPPTE